MTANWSVVTVNSGARTEEDLRRQYGEETVISKVGNFNLIHLDQPDSDEVERRVREFDPQDLFEDDCPLCRMMRDQGGEVLYFPPDQEGAPLF